MKLFNRLFAKKFSICSECGVHFEPVVGYEERWGHLCQAHRKEVRRRDEKRDCVMVWASANWEKLAKQMDEERAEAEAQYNKSRQAAFDQMARAHNQMAQASMSCYGALNGLQGR